MKIDESKMTPELFRKAAACKNVDELLALARESGFEVTKEEAEAYLAELSDYELNQETMEKVFGGGNNTYCYAVGGCAFKCSPLDGYDS